MVSSKRRPLTIDPDTVDPGLGWGVSTRVFKRAQVKEALRMECEIARRSKLHSRDQGPKIR